MSFKSTALIARKSIRFRFGRLIAISVAILVGAPRRRSPSSSPTACATRSTTCSPRSARTSTSRSAPSWRSATTAPTSSASSSRPASPTRSPRSRAFYDRTTAAALRPAGRPGRRAGLDACRRSAWPGAATHRCPGWRSRARAGHRPGPTRWPSTRPAPIGENFAVGDTIEVITDTGTHPFTITASSGSVTATGSPAPPWPRGTSRRRSR